MREMSNEDMLKRAFIQKQMSAERLRIHNQQKVERGLFRNKITFNRDDMEGKAIYQFETYIHGLADENLKYHFTCPLDWWESFKERWFPNWLLGKFPIKYFEQIINEKRYKAVCPHLFQNDQRDHLIWMALMDDDQEMEPYTDEDIERWNEDDEVLSEDDINDWNTNALKLLEEKI